MSHSPKPGAARNRGWRSEYDGILKRLDLIETDKDTSRDMSSEKRRDYVGKPSEAMFQKLG
jgi:hypothetical protein